MPQKNLSYVKGSTYPPLQQKSISEKLFETVKKYPSNPALICYKTNKILTYSEVYKESKKIASNLLDLGLKKNDKVGIYSPNNIEWYLTQLGCVLADLIMVTINPAYRFEELVYCLNSTQISTVVGDRNKFLKNDIMKNLEMLVLENKGRNFDLEIDSLPFLRNILVIDSDGSKEELKKGLEFYKEYLQEKNPSLSSKEKVEKTLKNQNYLDPTNIQFTSGTTGKPKGVILSHYNILNNSNFLSNRIHYTEKDILCLPVPFYHCFGMVMGTLSMINCGGSILLPSPGFDAVKSMEAVEKFKATSIYGVPTMFIEYLKVLENQRNLNSVNNSDDMDSRNLDNSLNLKNNNGYDISSLDKGVMAGSLCPEILLKRVQNEMGIKNFTVAYGMTETSPISFFLKPEDSDIKKTTTVGSILEHNEARIVDEKGNILPINESGELEVKGYSVMLGYYNNKKSTDKAIVSGWMRTGDICKIDSDGYLSVTGRSKDLIIRGGENISPKEIEDCLLNIENIENAQVIGVPDERLGEEVCALLKIKDNCSFDVKIVKTELDKHLAYYKIPKFVKIVENLPITVTGKPQKFKMRQEWNEEKMKKGNMDCYKIK